MEESAPAASAHDSEPTISDSGIEMTKLSDLAKGRHRLASSSKAENDASEHSSDSKTCHGLPLSCKCFLSLDCEEGVGSTKLGNNIQWVLIHAHQAKSLPRVIFQL